MTDSELLKKIEAYLATASMSPSRFGIATVNDPNFVFEMRKGRRTSLVLADKVCTYMQEKGEENGRSDRT